MSASSFINKYSGVPVAYTRRSTKVVADASRGCRPVPSDWETDISRRTGTTSQSTTSLSTPLELVECKPTDRDWCGRATNCFTAQESVLKRGPRPQTPCPTVISRWTEFVHPEGQLYYTTIMDQAAPGRGIVFVTDHFIRIPEERARMEEAAEHLVQLLCAELRDSVLPLACEVCVLLLDDKNNKWGYYIVDHEAQNVFFAREVSNEAVGLHIPGHVDELVDLSLTIEYWQHVADYPCHAAISEQGWDVLSSILTALATDECLGNVLSTPSNPDTMMTRQSLYLRAKAQRGGVSRKTALHLGSCAKLASHPFGETHESLRYRVRETPADDYNRRPGKSPKRGTISFPFLHPLAA